MVTSLHSFFVTGSHISSSKGTCMFLQNGLLTILHCFSFASLGTLTTILCSTSAHLCCTIFLHTFSSASTSTCLTTHLQSLTGCGLHSLCCSVRVVSRHTSFFTSTFVLSHDFLSNTWD